MDQQNQNFKKLNVQEAHNSQQIKLLYIQIT
jgi:hypothetical protein